MDILKGEVVYNKFFAEKIEIKIKGRTVERISMACEIFIKYLQEELPNTINPDLKDNVKTMARIVKELSNLKPIDNEEGSLLLTIAEFLIFKYAIESVAKLVGSLIFFDLLSIEYTDFMICLDEIYKTINENDVKVYYEFLAGYDTLKERVLN